MEYKLKDLVITTSEICPVLIHDLRQRDTSLIGVNRHLGIDDLTHKLVETLIQRISAAAIQGVDVLEESRVIKANEVDSRVPMVSEKIQPLVIWAHWAHVVERSLDIITKETMFELV